MCAPMVLGGFRGMPEPGKGPAYGLLSRVLRFQHLSTYENSQEQKSSHDSSIHVNLQRQLDIPRPRWPYYSKLRNKRFEEKRGSDLSIIWNRRPDSCTIVCVQSSNVDCISQTAVWIIAALVRAESPNPAGCRLCRQASRSERCK